MRTLVTKAYFITGDNANRTVWHRDGGADNCSLRRFELQLAGA